MSIYAISDLHLSGAKDKPMDMFGDEWSNHSQKIQDNWIKKIKDNDTILICGDTSWAMKTEDARVDLDMIGKLPGRKIFIKGNHDYWWNSTGKLNGMYENMVFLQNTFETYEDFAICGSRGWDFPGEKSTATDIKIYKRELGRMKLSLDAALSKGHSKILFMIHFPPLLNGMDTSEVINLLSQYPIVECLYGHLHGKDNFKAGFQGRLNGCNYKLVSADYIDFDPVLIF